MSETLQTPVGLPHLPSVHFTISPAGSPITWTVNGNTYPKPGQPQRYKYFTDQELTFTALPYEPPGVRIVKYHWDFGDRIEGFGQTVKHRYRAVNPSNRVSLCITDNYGRRYCTGQTFPLVMGTTVTANENVITLVA